MRKFEYKRAASFEEAQEILKGGKAAVLAGGTDILNAEEQRILADHPEVMVDIKKIPGASEIEDKGSYVSIGTAATLTDAATSALLCDKAKAVAEAAASVATPLIRNMGTVGGNLCQDVRCWFYRYPQEIGGRIDCARKGGAACYAIQGENRYHSIFGGMKVHTGECTKNCPAGTDISAYLQQIRKGNWDNAARIIMNVNPMPMITSRVCPHPCQDGCNQKQHGECVSIHCVERTLGDYILANAGKFYQAPKAESGRKVAIIGAGPGGLAAAYYLRKAGNDVTVYDEHEKTGGVLRYGIPHYRLPKDIIDKLTEALKGMGIRFVMNTKVGDAITAEELKSSNDALYFGTGAWRQPVLGIDGEKLTSFGLDFLTEVNTYLKKAIGEEVLVCGGGNVAMDVALTAVRLGAKHVKLVCLEQEKEMPASAEEVARAKEEGVEIFNGWGLGKVLTDKEGKVSGLESMRCTSVFNQEGRFAPQYDQSDKQIFKSDYIILATGQRVDISFLGEKLSEQLKSNRGLIGADPETARTADSKIYAGGDAVTGPNIAIKAIAAGGSAARSINRSFGIEVNPFEADDPFLTFDAKGICVTENAKLQEKTVKERTLTDEDAASLSMEEAKKEAGRCMNCGCYSVNASDLSPVMVALDAKLVTTEKTVAAKDFFTTKLKACDMLSKGELLKEIRIPVREGYKTGYIKDRLRKSIDFAIVSLAYSYKMEDGVIRDIDLVLGGVAPVPYILTEVNEFLKGKKITAETAKEAGRMAVANAAPMAKNAYKINTAEAMVKRFLESLQ